MEKYRFIGKTKDEAIQQAKEKLQETENNLIIRELETVKGGLFKSKKVEIEVIEKREVIKSIKDYIYKITKLMGINSNIEIKNKEEVPKFVIFSDNDAMLIGKNGKNLKALSTIVSAYVNVETGSNYKFKEKREQTLERMAKKIAREVAATNIEAKLDSMNSYERRIIHNVLTNHKKVYTESEGEEPNRYVVIKPKNLSDE